MWKFGVKNVDFEAIHHPPGKSYLHFQYEEGDKDVMISILVVEMRLKCDCDAGRTTVDAFDFYYGSGEPKPHQ